MKTKEAPSLSLLAAKFALRLAQHAINHGYGCSQIRIELDAIRTIEEGVSSAPKTVRNEVRGSLAPWKEQVIQRLGELFEKAGVEVVERAWIPAGEVIGEWELVVIHPSGKEFRIA